MAEQVLMEKAGERMNVPDHRLEEFLADGWKEISRTSAPEADKAKSSKQKAEGKAEKTAGSKTGRRTRKGTAETVVPPADEEAESGE